jgi:hypothetical protein
MGPSVRSPAMKGLRIRPMRPDEISIAVSWAAAEGWNPGLADDACFAAADREGNRRARRRGQSITADTRTVRVSPEMSLRLFVVAGGVWPPNATKRSVNLDVAIKA